MRNLRWGWGVLSGQLAFPMQPLSGGHPGRAGRAMGVPEQPPRCRPPLGTQRALSGPSKPAMSCSSGLASRQPEKLRWAEPCILQQAFCPGAPLSRGRCPGPRGGGRRPKVDEKKQQEAGRGAGKRCMNKRAFANKEWTSCCGSTFLMVFGCFLCSWVSHLRF